MTVCVDTAYLRYKVVWTRGTMKGYVFVLPSEGGGGARAAHDDVEARGREPQLTVTRLAHRSDTVCIISPTATR